MALRPDNRVQRRFTGVQVGLTGLSPVRPFEDFPEQVKAEVNRYADIIRDEVLILEAAGDGIESIEENDQAEEDCGSIAEIWLER